MQHVCHLPAVSVSLFVGFLLFVLFSSVSEGKSSYCSNRPAWFSGHSPELHPAIDQSQRDEVLLAILAIVEKNASHLRCSELHGDADGMVGAHSLESQVGLTSKWWDEVLDHYGGTKHVFITAGWGESRRVMLMTETVWSSVGDRRPQASQMSLYPGEENFWLFCHSAIMITINPSESNGSWWAV